MTARWLRRAMLGVVISMALATAGFAQYGNPTSYTKPQGGYGSGTAIALAAGGAAAVALGVYFLHHKHAKQSQETTLVGCTEMDNGTLTLTDDSTRITYSVPSLSKSVRAGERLILSGTSSQSSSGMNVFRVRKLIRDDGPCGLRATNPGSAWTP